MTTTQVHTEAPTLGRPGPWLPRLLRSEYRKVASTHVWWWLLLGTVLWTGLALAFNIFTAQLALHPPEGVEAPPEAAGGAVYHASNIYTSGQFLGLLFVMLLGIIMVTSEYFHQTATVTYLTTPHRTLVIVAKLILATLASVLYWLVTTAIALAGGVIYFGTQEYGLLLGEWDVQRSILLNLLAFVIWAAFGVAVGVLLTNQLAATIVAVAVYVLGFAAAGFGFAILAAQLNNETIAQFQVLMPSIASQVMVSGGGEDIPGNPAWWVGALVLLGYAVVAGTIGILINRKRDIS